MKGVHDMSTATLILFHDGQPVQTPVGVQPKSALKAAIDAQLG
jgi:thioredoxin-like negative regulator of GroEL